MFLLWIVDLTHLFVDFKIRIKLTSFLILSYSTNKYNMTTVVVLWEIGTSCEMAGCQHPLCAQVFNSLE